MAPIALLTPPETSTINTSKQLAQSTQPVQFHHAAPAPVAVSAEGMYVTLSDGRTILDGVSGGAAVAGIGMGRDDVIQVMAEQAKKLGYAYHQLLGNGPAEELAQWLVDRSQGAFESAAFLNSGSEAMEAAIKLCRQYWVEKGEMQRKYIIARFPSYHGNTLGALAVGNVPARRELYSPLFSDFIHHVPSPTYKRSHRPDETEEAYSVRLAEELDAKIMELGPENVMAFFAEPVVGAALGVMPPPKGYFPAVNAVVQKHGLLLVLDEIMSGSGRVGELFAHQAICEGVTPDIMGMAKGLGGGYVPISAVLVNAKVAQVVRQAGQWKNSHTYQNHPTVCAVARKVVQIIEDEGLLANVRERGAQLLSELKQGLNGVEGVFDIRGKGLFIGVELTAPSTLKPRVAVRVKERCLQNGLLVLGLPGIIDGYKGDSVTLAPAYIVTEQQVTQIAQILCRSVKECLAEI